MWGDGVIIRHDRFLDIDVRLRNAIRFAINKYPKFLNNYFEPDAVQEIIANRLKPNCDLGIIIKMILEADPTVIFSKYFAQAFWFSDDAGIIKVSYFPPEEGHPSQQTVKYWQYHQIQMMLVCDPLVYLDGFMQ